MTAMVRTGRTISKGSLSRCVRFLIICFAGGPGCTAVEPAAGISVRGSRCAHANELAPTICPCVSESVIAAGKGPV